MACLLEPDSLLRVHQHLAAGRLRMPYLADVTKSFSVEQGHLTANLDISLKDAYERWKETLLKKSRQKKKNFTKK